MVTIEVPYFKQVVFHIGIAIVLFFLKFLALPWGIFLLIYGTFIVVKYQNRNNEALFISAYLVGSEVFLRMTGGYLFYEIVKYSVIYFLLLGMLLNGFPKNNQMYWIFLALLIPGLCIGLVTLNGDSEIRKSISFNISGPVCLAFASLYCYQRKFSFDQLNKLLLYIGMPIISTVTTIFLVAPNVKKLAIGTASNTQLAGGFGSNQVATLLGLGCFCFFTHLLFKSKKRSAIAIDLILLFLIAFRGIVTFSRGGMYTSFAMIMVLMLVIFWFSKSSTKFFVVKFVLIAGLFVSLSWSFISYQTNGFIDKRYANKDPIGRVKKDQFSGRQEIFAEELTFFFDHPFFGIGVGKSKETRQEELGTEIASHSEISRMLSEHGLFGLVGLLILSITPFVLYSQNKQHIYFWSFYLFWILTINHAAMRLAAPAFVYGLCLLKIQFEGSVIKAKDTTV